MEITYSLADLVALVSAAEGIGLSERTVRQYFTDGLLPAPSARGGTMPYGEEHLLHLRLLTRLAGQYVPLREIQRFIGRLSADGLRALVDRPLSARLPSEGDAQAYLTRLSRSLPAPLMSQGLFTGALAPSSRPSMVSARPRGLPPALKSLPSTAEELNGSGTPRGSVSRSPWLRVSIDADIEISIRGNGHDQRRLVDALVAAVQDVLATERGAGP